MLTCCFCSAICSRLWHAKASVSVLQIGRNDWEIWLKTYNLFLNLFSCYYLRKSNPEVKEFMKKQGFGIDYAKLESYYVQKYVDF